MKCNLTLAVSNPHLRLMDLLQDHKDRENTSVAAVQQALRRRVLLLNQKSWSGELLRFCETIEGMDGSSKIAAYFSETVASC